MENNKDLLIVEMSSNALSVTDKESKDYVLEGIFGQIDVKNKNQRIYSEGEYVPQIKALQDKIKSGKLLGELDHPSQFDVSLKNVSHVIEDLYYEKDTKQVKGRIRLLDTDAGRQAKALVDARVPLQISSRAAGAVESNGKVKIKQLFTYDLVADPGFENAELKRVNESYGFSNENGLYIFEINKEDNKQTQIIENQDMADFVKAEDFNKYTEYLANEIKSLKEALETKESDANENNELKGIKAHNDHIVENVNGISKYVEYLAEKLDQGIQYSEHVAEKADQGIQYSESVAEKLDQSIQYSEHLAEKLDNGISYTEHVAESLASLKDYANYLAESHNENTASAEKLIEYTNYLKENLQSVTEYAEYIAESINENMIVEAEEGEEAGEPAEDMDSELDNSEQEIAPEGDEAKDKSAELEKELEDTADDAGKGVVSANEAYKNEISEKLNTLVETATKKENENPSFFKVVSSRIQEKYNALNEDAKKEVRYNVSRRGFMTESQIESIIDKSTLIVENRNSAPLFIDAMPAEYKETWENLSEAKQNQIKAQANYHKLETEYQVRNFWQTRDLRESAPAMEKLEMVKESKREEAKGLGYDVSNYAAELKKRFNK
jgi:ABC-type transporter Mla subunit MlaD